MVVALVIAVLRLRAQETAAQEVIVTGLYAVGGVLLLFGLLLGVGRGLGTLVRQGEDENDEGP